MSTLGSLVGTRSLPAKVYPKKNPQSKKSTVSDSESNYLLDTVECFFIVSFFGVNFCGKTPAIKATISAELLLASHQCSVSHRVVTFYNSIILLKINKF